MRNALGNVDLFREEKQISQLCSKSGVSYKHKKAFQKYPQGFHNHSFTTMVESNVIPPSLFSQCTK